MKQIAIFILVIILASCQVSFDPGISGTIPTPIVYCLLDLNDSLQFVRLGKSFSPGLEGISQDPIHLDPWDEVAEVYMEEISPNNNTVIHFFRLSNEDPEQDSGRFMAPSYQLYTSAFKPKPETEYNLYVFLKKAGIHCFSSTTSVGFPVIADPAPIPSREISFSPFDDYIIHYYAPSHSSYQECYFEFGDWRFGKTQTGSPQENGRFLTLSSERFFKEADPLANFDHPTFHLICYGEELAIYNQLFEESSGSFSPSAFSSITNGAGLFSSKVETLVVNLEISKITKDLINSGFQFTGSQYANPEGSSVVGQFDFHFILPTSVLPKGKVHRTELKLAYTVDSLYKGLFFATVNVSDTREEYSFVLPKGSYYYQAGITCSCLSDSCLWDGFTNGQFGKRYATDKFSIQAGLTTDEKPAFQ